MRKISILLLLCVAASGCTVQMIRSQILVFHELSEGHKPTYALLPFKEQEGSLEYKTYEGLVRQQMNAKGFREVPIDQAEVVGFIQYGIDTGKEVVYSYPIIGRTGTSSSYTTGTIQSFGGYATYSGTMYNTPTYGVVGTGVGSRTVYTRYFRFDMVERASLAGGTVKNVYETRVVSRGSSGEISTVLPTMIRALFEEFPGKSGSTRTVILRREQ